MCKKVQIDCDEFALFASLHLFYGTKVNLEGSSLQVFYWTSKSRVFIGFTKVQICLMTVVNSSLNWKLKFIVAIGGVWAPRTFSLATPLMESTVAEFDENIFLDSWPADSFKK